jgi:hypothetical protein
MSFLTKDQKDTFWRDGRGKPGRCKAYGETLAGHPRLNPMPRHTADMG